MYKNCDILSSSSFSAVTTSRIALYAGLAPSGGLQFTPETVVNTLWPSQGGFESASLDWTETQKLQSGWLRSRTRTQFVTTSHRDERGRLDVDWLRIKPGWRPAVASIVVVALLHVGVVERAVGETLPYSTLPIGVLAVVGTLLELEGVRRGIRRWVLCVQASWAARGMGKPAPLYGYVCEHIALPHALFIFPRITIPRAPPAI